MNCLKPALLAFLLVISFAVKAQDQDVSFLNATLVAKLHLDSNPAKSQMVGAYQISFRAPEGGFSGSLQFLLNPGLTLEKVIGSNNRALSTQIRTISTASIPNLTAVTVKLAASLKAQARDEIIIHYRGNLAPLNARDFANDSLNLELSFIRPQSLAYPVFAPFNDEGIQKALKSTQMQQTAFVEIAGSHTVVGSLDAREKILKGTRTDFNLSSTNPAGLFTLVIGAYELIEEDTYSLAFLPDSRGNTQNAAALLSQTITALSSKFGTPTKGEKIRFMEVPEGQKTFDADGAFFVKPAFFSNPTLTDDMMQAITGLWQINTAETAGHWAEGLDTVTLMSAQSKLDAAFTNALFQTARNRLDSGTVGGKVALKDYAIEGYIDTQKDISALAFAVLHNLMGEDAFAALVRDVRSQTIGRYSDMETLTEVLDASIKDKKAQKFAESWFDGNRIGRDLSRTETFEALVGLYR